MEEGVIEVGDGWWLVVVGQRIGRDAGAGVGVDEGLVKVGFFDGG